MLWLAAKTRLMANIILKKWQQNRFYIESSTFDYVNEKTNKQKNSYTQQALSKRTNCNPKLFRMKQSAV